MNQCALLPAEKPSSLLNIHSAQLSQISLKTKEGTNTTDGKALPSNLQNQLLSEIIVPEHLTLQVSEKCSWVLVFNTYSLTSVSEFRICRIKSKNEEASSPVSLLKLVITRFNTVYRALLCFLRELFENQKERKYFISTYIVTIPP